MKGIKLKEDECISSYDVKALFTSVPVELVIKIIRQKLEQENKLPYRTVMNIGNIISLLEFCLKNTHFLFRDKYYEELERAAMGSNISPIVANHFLESFETKALSKSTNPSSLWKRYVDDTEVCLQEWGT